MYEIRVSSFFSAAHRLRGYRGKCEELHGHNWKVQICVECHELDKIGIALDFKDLKDQLKGVLRGLDHKCLNSLSFFKKANPSSEMLAKFIFQRFSPRVKKLGCNLAKVSVWESENTCATYKV